MFDLVTEAKVISEGCYAVQLEGKHPKVTRLLERRRRDPRCHQLPKSDHVLPDQLQLKVIYERSVDGRFSLARVVWTFVDDAGGQHQSVLFDSFGDVGKLSQSGHNFHYLTEDLAYSLILKPIIRDDRRRILRDLAKSPDHLLPPEEEAGAEELERCLEDSSRSIDKHALRGQTEHLAKMIR